MRVTATYLRLSPPAESGLVFPCRCGNLVEFQVELTPEVGCPVVTNVCSSCRETLTSEELYYRTGAQ